MKSLLVLILTATGAIACSLHSHNPKLAPRQDYEDPPSCEDSDYTLCGEQCIPQSWTCCPREDGGCPPGTECFIDGDGDGDGETACCLYGDCDGHITTMDSSLAPTPTTGYGTAAFTWVTTTTFSWGTTITVGITTLTFETPTVVTSESTGTVTGTEGAPEPTGAAASIGGNLLGAIVAAGAAFVL
ncbi:hypothetical protein ACO1O0_001468 [Amphichorda felina]